VVNSPGDSYANRENLERVAANGRDRLAKRHLQIGASEAPGGLEACFTWRLRSSAMQYCRGRKMCFACFGCAWSTRLWWYLEGRLAGIPWVIAQNVSLELWLKIGVKHVAFLELWLRMTSLELWLGMTDEHKELLSCGSGWRVFPVWVCELWLVWQVQIDCPHWYENKKFGSLGTLRMIFVLGTPPGIPECGP